jgi:hypothetical protein
MEEEKIKRLFVISLQFENAFGILGQCAISKAGPGATSLPIVASAPAIPAVVCGAFALELQLKCLFAMETGKAPPRSHNLRRLFELTTDSSQKAIRETYSNLLREDAWWAEQFARVGVSTDFDDVLDSCKDAFAEWRYLYEYDKSRAWHGAPMHKAVRDEIFKLRPNWRNLIGN